ncbi:MAG TPA: PP2C family protein-serine/threonine phosphatase [Anaerolineales bacterium]|nr:PP2C family protein-serine/threonine phosphatase [Anaerolineales bacterium]
MDTNLVNDIRRGLEEKRATVCERCRRDEAGMVDDRDVQPHLHVIDESLQKLEAGTLGVCTVCQGIVDERLLQMDYTACVCLDHYSSQERRQLENELELSQVVQRALLPQQVPELPGFDIAGFSRPAQIIGGDYFDFLAFNDGAHGLVVADVSGKGVSAGILMTSLQTAFHTIVPETDSPLKVLEKINRLYIHNIKFTTFVTIFFAKIDPRTRTLVYANAGHAPALLYHARNKEHEWLRRTGLAIGLMEEFSVHSESLQLERGDTLVFYTDGVTEAMSPRQELFERERLAEVIAHNEGAPADALIQKILQALNEFAQGDPLADDATLVVCKVQ